MLSIQDREIAITIVNALVEYGLTDHLAQCGEHGTENWFFDNNLINAQFRIGSGATKVCISHPDLANWVIKVGYTQGVKHDYATIEYNNYCKAEEAGFARYFPETIYLGEFGGRAFYVQAECDCDEDQVTSDWYERLRDGYEEDGEEIDCDRLWDEVYNLDDDEKAFLMFQNGELCRFLWENGIGDLHEGNFGYYNGCAVIIDFSGYMG